MTATMPRSLRIDPELWHAAVARARSEQTTLTAVVVAFLTDYTKEGTK